MSLNVIGAGLGRTGTMSLKVALEQLGFGPCYHMVECLPKGPEHWRLWVEGVKGAAVWDKVFEGYQSAVDFPACSSYQSLANHYPESKVVLTVRDTERWFDSTQETIFMPEWAEFLKSSPMAEFMQHTVFNLFDGNLHDKAHVIKTYENHLEAVKRNIPPSRLLLFNVKEGWGPLCEFLGIDEPETEFPRINDAAETKQTITDIMQGAGQARD